MKLNVIPEWLALLLTLWQAVLTVVLTRLSSKIEKLPNDTKNEAQARERAFAWFYRVCAAQLVASPILFLLGSQKAVVVAHTLLLASIAAATGLRAVVHGARLAQLASAHWSVQPSRYRERGYLLAFLKERAPLAWRDTVARLDTWLSRRHLFLTFITILAVHLLMIGLKKHFGFNPLGEYYRTFLWVSGIAALVPAIIAGARNCAAEDSLLRR